MIMILSRHGKASLPLLSIVVALALISSCSPGTDPGPCETFECREISYLLTVNRDVYQVGVDSVHDHVTLHAIFIPHAPVVRSTSYNDGIDGGFVKFNETTLMSSTDAERGVRYTFNAPTDSVLAPEGELNEWDISGSGMLVQAFTASMPTPSLLRVDEVEGASNDTIDVDTDLVVRWNEGSTIDTTFDFVSLYGWGKDGSIYDLSPVRSFGRDTTLDSFYRVPIDSLRVWQETLTEISFSIGRETIHDLLVPRGERGTRDRWARLVFREYVQRSFSFRP